MKSTKPTLITNFFPLFQSSSHSNRKPCAIELEPDGPTNLSVPVSTTSLFSKENTADLDRTISTHSKRKYTVERSHNKISKEQGKLDSSVKKKITPNNKTLSSEDVKSDLESEPIEICEREKASTLHVSGALPVVDLTQDSPPKSTQQLAWFEKFTDSYQAQPTAGKKISKESVHGCWPGPGEVHQRSLAVPPCLTTSPPKNNQPRYRLRLNKGKRPYCPRNTLDLNMSDFFRSWHELEALNHESAVYPELVRLDLGSPLDLVPEIKDNPIFQHPLFVRLMHLFSSMNTGDHDDGTAEACTNSVSSTHPALLRQHHRPVHAMSNLWTSKYTPQSSAEILGQNNATNAQILKSWLLHVALKKSHDKANTHNSKNRCKASSESQSTRLDKKRKNTRKDARPKIIRNVAKLPKVKSTKLYSEGDRLSDFIVDNSDEEDTIHSRDIELFDIDDEPSESDRDRSSVNDLASQTTDLGSKVPSDLKYDFDQLTNLIILKGPNGVGKTCMVYSIAKELGWEVFEVNSSMLRSHKLVERLVGDVSKNHVVSMNPSQPSDSTKYLPSPSSNLNPQPKSQINNFFARSKRDKRKSELIDPNQPQSKPTMTDTDSHEDADINDQKGLNDTKQSLILLEEVDNIYQQDKDFWPGLVEFISTSMRPIIMTCNSLVSIPVDSLPVQMVLELEPPSKELASAYLQLISLLEGHLIDRKRLEDWYNHEQSYRYPLDLEFVRTKRSGTHYLALNASEDDGCAHGLPDLRKSITELQFWAQWAVGSEMSGVSWLDLSKDKDQKMLFSRKSCEITRPVEDEDQMGLLERVSLHRQRHKKSTGNINRRQDVTEIQAAEVAKSLDQLAHAYDGISFTDAFVDARKEVVIEEHENDSSLSPGCDEDDILLGLGTTGFKIPERISEREVLWSYKKDREISIEILNMIIDQLESNGLEYELLDERKFNTSQLDYLKKLDDFMDIKPSDGWIVKVEDNLTDHAGFIHKFVRIDDENIKKQTEEKNEDEDDEEDERIRRLRKGGRNLRKRIKVNHSPFNRYWNLDECKLNGIRLMNFPGLC